MHEPHHEQRWRQLRHRRWLASDDAAARATVVSLADDLGFEGVGLGLSHARELEPMAMLWISLAQRLGRGARQRPDAVLRRGQKPAREHLARQWAAWVVLGLDDQVDGDTHHQIVALGPAAAVDMLHDGPVGQPAAVGTANYSFNISPAPLSKVVPIAIGDQPGADLVVSNLAVTPVSSDVRSGGQVVLPQAGESIFYGRCHRLGLRFPGDRGDLFHGLMHPRILDVQRHLVPPYRMNGTNVPAGRPTLCSDASSQIDTTAVDPPRTSENRNLGVDLAEKRLRVVDLR